MWGTRSSTWCVPSHDRVSWYRIIKYCHCTESLKVRMIAEGFKSISRLLLYSPPGSHLYTWHWLCVLAKSGLVSETWKQGTRNSPGFFLLDSASSVRGLSQVFVSLVTTSHKFFSPLLINKLTRHSPLWKRVLTLAYFRLTSTMLAQTLTWTPWSRAMWMMMTLSAPETTRGPAHR